MTNEADAYCNGCRHLKYDRLENFAYCNLDKKLKPHPDEPESFYCEDWGE